MKPPEIAQSEKGNRRGANISTLSVTPKRKKRGRLFLFQLLLVLGFLAAVWFSFGQNVLAPRTPQGVLKRLGAMELVSTVEGAQAIAEITKLHGTDIKLASAYIAEYTHSSPYHGNSHATVWVGTAGSRDAAIELTSRMVAGIQKGGSGFNNLQRLSIDGQEIFGVSGAGGEHFFYTAQEPGEKVVWVTIEGAEALSVLEQVVKNF